MGKTGTSRAAFVQLDLSPCFDLSTIRFCTEQVLQIPQTLFIGGGVTHIQRAVHSERASAAKRLQFRGQNLIPNLHKDPLSTTSFYKILYKGRHVGKMCDVLSEEDSHSRTRGFRKCHDQANFRQKVFARTLRRGVRAPTYLADAPSRPIPSRISGDPGEGRELSQSLLHARAGGGSDTAADQAIWL